MRHSFGGRGTRAVWLTLVGLSLVQPVFADIRKVQPEQYIPADAIVYYRFDGLLHHRAAYDKTAFAEMMRGDFGKSLRTLSTWLYQELRDDPFQSELTLGVPPTKLALLHRVHRDAPIFVEHMLNEGFVFALDQQVIALQISATLVIQTPTDPAFTARLQRWIADACQWFGMTPRHIEENITWEAQSDNVHLISNRIGGFWVLRLKMGPAVSLWTSLQQLFGGNLTKPNQRVAKPKVSKGWKPPEKSLISAPQYQELIKFRDYPTLARGYIQWGSTLGLLRLVPQMRDFLEQLGIDDLQGTLFYTGITGRDFRNTTIWCFGGRAHGLLDTINTAHKPFSWQDLPPLPPDMLTLNIIHIKPAAMFRGMQRLLDTFADFFPDTQAISARQHLRAQEALWGFTLQKGIFECLDGPVILYNSSTDGPLGTGTVIAIQVKNRDNIEKNLYIAMKNSVRAIDRRIKWTEHVFHGGKFLQFAIPQFPLAPTIMIHQQWLLVSISSQPMKGLLLRHAGKAKKWDHTHSDAQTLVANLAECQHPVVSMGYVDARVFVRLVLEFMPLYAGALGAADESFFNAHDFPHTQEVIDNLRPTLSTWTFINNNWRFDSVQTMPMDIGGSEFLGIYWLAIISSTLILLLTTWGCNTRAKQFLSPKK